MSKRSFRKVRHITKSRAGARTLLAARHEVNVERFAATHDVEVREQRGDYVRRYVTVGDPLMGYKSLRKLSPEQRKQARYERLETERIARGERDERMPKVNP